MTLDSVIVEFGSVITLHVSTGENQENSERPACFFALLQETEALQPCFQGYRLREDEPNASGIRGLLAGGSLDRPFRGGQETTSKAHTFGR